MTFIVNLYRVLYETYPQFSSKLLTLKSPYVLLYDDPYKYHFISIFNVFSLLNNNFKILFVVKGCKS